MENLSQDLDRVFANLRNAQSILKTDSGSMAELTTPSASRSIEEALASFRDASKRLSALKYKQS